MIPEVATRWRWLLLSSLYTGFVQREEEEVNAGSGAHQTVPASFLGVPGTPSPHARQDGEVGRAPGFQEDSMSGAQGRRKPRSMTNKGSGGSWVHPLPVLMMSLSSERAALNLRSHSRVRLELWPAASHIPYPIQSPDRAGNLTPEALRLPLLRFTSFSRP